jgi:hypothetical protein
VLDTLHCLLVSQAGISRQGVLREAPRACALAGGRESVPGDPAGTSGAVPQVTSMTP